MCSILKDYSGIWILDVLPSSIMSYCLCLTKQIVSLNSGTSQLIIGMERIHFQPGWRCGSYTVDWRGEQDRMCPRSLHLWLNICLHFFPTRSAIQDPLHSFPPQSSWRNTCYVCNIFKVSENWNGFLRFSGQFVFLFLLDVRCCKPNH